MYINLPFSFAGSGSLSSASAKSVSTHRSESRLGLEESFSSSNSLTNSPDVVDKVIKNGRVVTLDSEDDNDDDDDDVEVRIKGKQGKKLNGGKKSNGSAVILASAAMELPTLRASGSAIGAPNQDGAYLMAGGAEFPRLPGTKSQASTASSSATRDSGISLNEMNNGQDHHKALLNGARKTLVKSGLKQHQQQQQQQQQQQTRGRRPSPKRSMNGTSQPQTQINLDNMPVNGHALSLTNRRPSLNR